MLLKMPRDVTQIPRDVTLDKIPLDVTDVTRNATCCYVKYHLMSRDVTLTACDMMSRTRQGDGLLLYMDDGGYYDFLEMKLVRGELHVRYK